MLWGNIKDLKTSVRGFKDHESSEDRSELYETKALNLQFVDTHRVPQRHLPLTDTTEAGGEDLPVIHEHRLHRPGALVRLLLLLQVEHSRRCYRLRETRCLQRNII